MVIKRRIANISTRKKRSILGIRKDWQLYAFLLPTILFLFLFHYMPLYGIQIAFKRFVEVQGIAGSAWVGLKNFQDFFSSYYWDRIILNTFLLNLMSLLFGFPAPIIIALMLNQVFNKKFKSTLQTILYAPHFISIVVMTGMLYIFLSPTSGIINNLLETIGIKPIYFMSDEKWFRPIYIISGIWQHAGWSSIIFLAALSAIEVQLYEAATIDGASQFQKVIHIDIPFLLPVIMTLFILDSATLLQSEFQKTYLMQTPGNTAVSDTIGVYVYKVGLLGSQFSYSSAIGLMMNFINFIILLSVNKLSKNTSNISLW